jgi:hypothetical protein
MQSNDLTTEQRLKLEGRVSADLTYLPAVLDRMSQRDFPEDDPLRVKAEAAHEAQLALLVAIQRLGRPIDPHAEHEAKLRAEHERISREIDPAVARANGHWR